MASALEEFRLASRGRGRRGPGRRYSEEQQALAVRHAAERQSQGRGIEEVALELRVHPLTLRRWMQRKRLFRPVEVAESRSSGSYAVVTPDGFRVEGVGREEIAEVIGLLR